MNEHAISHSEAHVTWHNAATELPREHPVVIPEGRGYGDSSKPHGGGRHVNYSFSSSGSGGEMRHFAQKRSAMEREKMSRETNWIAEAPAINHNACVEIENTTLVNTAVDNSEFCSSRLCLNFLILAHLVTLSALEGM